MQHHNGLDQPPNSSLEAKQGQVVPLVQIGFRGERYFELSDAIALLPIINKLTRTLNDNIGAERQRLSRLLPCDPRSRAISRAIAPSIFKWKSELERLGCRVFDLSNIGFFNGDGFYLARPEDNQIRYFVMLGAALKDKIPMAKLSDLSAVIEHRRPLSR